MQGISGTGSLRIGGAFLAKFFPFNKELFLPTPSWGNHNPIFLHSGLKVNKYRYYDPSNCGFDFKGALDDISVSPFDNYTALDCFLAFEDCYLAIKDLFQIFLFFLQTNEKFVNYF